MHSVTVLVQFFGADMAAETGQRNVLKGQCIFKKTTRIQKTLMNHVHRLEFGNTQERGRKGNEEMVGSFLLLCLMYLLSLYFVCTGKTEREREREGGGGDKIVQ